MSRHYKKLILLLIPACAGFCLALALGSAEETSELCQLCQNKAIVKEGLEYLTSFVWNVAINNDANLPDIFDPNYVQYGQEYYDEPLWDTGPALPFGGQWAYAVEFEYIIAEGDMVSVFVSFEYLKSYTATDVGSQFAVFRIANGKIVEGFFSVASLRCLPYGD